ncbi:MAG TPA: MFS transporter [Rhizomicrobium sp.]|jgi:ACS family hexuronate transporter-like MFS transporter|nr:MFS transporter [Rhizomicrobium sp.]
MSIVPDKQAATAPFIGGTRWIVCALLFAAIALSYIDRQVLSVLKPTLQHDYAWSETGYGNVVFWFQAAYGVGYIAFGRIVDKIGARLGYALAVTLWTIGHMAHALVTTTLGFAIVRIPLALGESGAFPASLAAVADWFPTRERTLAIGLFNAGSNIGAILAPLIVPIVTLAFGWRMAFVLTGLLTVIWLVVWLWFYRRPREHKGVSARELAHIESDRLAAHATIPWRRLLRRRQTWAYIAGRFLIDPIWWTFLFWLPDFFGKRYGLDLKSYGPPLVAIYVLADVGSILGGWGSSTLLGRGFSINVARKTAMLICALAVVPVAFAVQAANLWLAVGLIGIACAGHQGFSANLYALPSDLFPRWAAGSVVGLGGAAGAMGGMLMAKYAGWVLQTLGSYTPIFIVAACAYLVALGTVHLLVPDYAPAEAEAA